jgi:L-cysteine desulfidase
MSIGVECGYWDFFGASEKKCECIGIKTGRCPPGVVCDGGSWGCIGICQNCIFRKFNSNITNWEIVPCK